MTAKVVVGGVDAGSPGSLWSVVPGSAATPISGSGATFTFTPTTLTDIQLTLTDSGQTAQRTVTAVPPPALVLSAAASPSAAAPGTPISFSATASGGTGSYASYVWDFGDGTTGTGASVSHFYASPNAYTASCTVTDSLGTTKTATAPVTVASTPTRFYTVTACRLFDTRNASGPDAAAPALAAQAARLFVVAGRCGISAAATAVSVNVTVTGAEQAGSLTLYPGDVAAPLATTISFRASQTRANNAVVKLAFDGSQTFGVLDSSAGTVHFILDVNGYFR